MKKWIALILCPLWVSGATVVEKTTEEVFSMARYKNIYGSKPFVEPEPPPPAPPPQPAPSKPTISFAKFLRLCSLMDFGDGMRAGFYDSKAKKDFIMMEGEILDGIELISINTEAESAVLRKGNEQEELSLNDEEKLAMAATESKQDRTSTREAPTPPKPPASYLARKKKRMSANKPPPAPPTAPPTPPAPKLTGEALHKHLQEYQMEVIRKGLPPLPIPLTPEQDEQLVQEGILPAQ